MGNLTIDDICRKLSEGRVVSPTLPVKLARDFYTRSLTDPVFDYDSRYEQDIMDLFDIEKTNVPYIEALERQHRISGKAGDIRLKDDLFIFFLSIGASFCPHHPVFDLNIIDYLELSGRPYLYEKWFKNDTEKWLEIQKSLPGVNDIIREIYFGYKNIKQVPSRIRVASLDAPAELPGYSEGSIPFHRDREFSEKALLELYATWLYIIMIEVPHCIFVGNRKISVLKREKKNE